MNYPAATLALGPFCFLQGHHLRRVTPVLPEPPGPREGRKGSGPTMRLLILGDSAAAGVGATRQEEGFAGQLVSCLAAQFTISWKLLAKTGATTGDTLDSLENTGAEPFDVVVVSLGVNDLTSGHQRWLWLKRQAKLIDLLNTKFEAHRNIALLAERCE